MGEAACTGLHGANRLGSNSLLEGLTFGARAGEEAGKTAKDDAVKFPLHLEHRVPPSTKTELDIVDVKSSLRSVMWRNVGIERTSDRLTETREIIGWNLRRLRVERGLSQERLALAAGIDRAYVGRVERGSENVTVATIEALASVLAVPVSALFAEPEPDAGRPLPLRAGRKPKHDTGTT